MGSTYKLEPGAGLGWTAPDYSSASITFDKKGLYRTDDVSEQMYLDGLVTSDAHPLKLAPESKKES
jgi:hypothetical protein